jgi:methylenetetrahydrofolate reductase (NADPH)
MIASMNAGALLGGERLVHPPDFLIAGAANPLVDSVQRLEAKLDAGVRLLQTNIVYDVDRFREWFAPLVASGIPARAPVLVGVSPPRSANMLRFLHERIPGVEVDQRTFGRMDGLEGFDAKEEGIRIAAEVVTGLREIEGVAGVHIMAPGWEVEAVPQVVALAQADRGGNRG